jgi:DNA invertase Pin-like site-specific DNA recombinase
MDYIAYYRVSTKRQGESGLGLADQQQAARRFAGSNMLLREFTEVESGKKSTNRPMLLEAIAACKRAPGRALLIAKLDRLSRSATFINALLDSGVEVKCVDMPEANRLMLGIMAQLAQWERETISQRTRAALAALKARGVKLGAPDGGRAGRERARTSHKTFTPTSAVVDQMREMRGRGCSYGAIASRLNALGSAGMRAPWSSWTVQRTMRRATAA